MMRLKAATLLGAAILVGCQSGEQTADAAADDDACVGKCDGLDGAHGSLPVVVRAASPDGRVVFGTDPGAEDGCRAMAVRPTRIDRNPGSVTFAPAAFSEGVACPAELGASAVAAAPGFDPRPFASDASGQPTPGGDHLTYQLSIVSSEDLTPDDDVNDPQLVTRQATVVMAAPYTDAAEVVDVQFSAPTGLGLLGVEPTITADGRLLVWRGNPDNAIVDDAVPLQSLVYSRLDGGSWTSPRSITALHTEADVDIDGLTLAERYPLAQAALRGPDGRTFGPGELYPAAYPWISQDGTELFHTTTLAGHPDRPGEEGRRGGVSVIGQATGHVLRHIDGPINASREGMTDAVTIAEYNFGLGRSQGVWAPYRQEGLVLPAHDKAPTYPMFGAVIDGASAFGTYNEVDFAVFDDEDYLVYLPMNESISTLGDFEYDLGHTPDISGHLNSGELSPGARFAVEEFGLDDDGLPVRDANTGAAGRAIYFSAGGRVVVPSSFELLSPGRGLSVSMFVQRLADAGDLSLLEWPGVASLSMGGDGTLIATVTSEGQARTTTAGTSAALEQWVHVGFSYDSIRGRMQVFVDGQLAGEQTFGRGFPGTATGDLIVGPGVSGDGGSADDSAVIALDEVAISRVFRTPDEMLWASSRQEPAGPPMGGVELMGSVEVPLGVDPDEIIVPAWAPVRDDVVELGRTLFFDPRLSANGEISCATCHDPEFAWTDGRAVGQAIDGTDLDRATPTIFNRALSTAQFWDGRSRSVEAQALSPIGSPREMNLPLDEAVARIASSPGYVEMFQAAFGRAPDRSGMANAIAAFERAQLAGDSPVDRFEAGQTDALTAAEQRGRELFHGKARCVSCHSGSNYTDEGFHELGIVQSNDMGRYYTSGGRAKFIRAFKTPTLRNIDVTGPYFHNGSVETLEDVVALYNAGPTGDGHDWEIRPLGLTAGEQADLVAFLRALTSPNAVQTFEVELPDMPGF